MEEDKYIDAKPIKLKELLKGKYIIPGYQRPYAWEKEHIYRFINTLMSNSTKYIGNILLEGGKNEHELKIVDGQQRITTLLLILYYFDYDKELIKNIVSIESESENKKLAELFELGKDGVINKIKSELEGVTKKELKEKENELKITNIYMLNFYYIAKFLENVEEIKDLENTYIVKVIINEEFKTTEKIFDLINTTGKPLEVKDKFKIRLYNYYNGEKKVKVIEEINKLYKEINEMEEKFREEKDKKEKELFIKYYKDNDQNKKSKNYIETVHEECDIEYVLTLFKFFLIAKKRKENPRYGSTLVGMGCETFYDGLFEYLFEKKSKKDHKEMLVLKEREDMKVEDECISYDTLENDETTEEDNCESILENRKMFKEFLADGCISIEDIKEIFETLICFKKFVNQKDKWNTADAYFAYNLFRSDDCNKYYSRYQYLPILYFYAFNKNSKGEYSKNFIKNFNDFIIALSKYCAIYSINYKRKDECNEFLSKQMEELFNNSKKTIKKYTASFKKAINKKVNTKENKAQLEKVLKDDIIESKHRKNTICLIVAEQEEKATLEEEKELKDKIELLFSSLWDIEHIYSVKTNEQNPKLTSEKENGIGNLMILERNINRSIKDSQIYELVSDKQKNKNKLDKYAKSKFAVVKKFINDFNHKYKGDTNLYLENKNMDDRIKDNINIIMNYFEIQMEK